MAALGIASARTCAPARRSLRVQAIAKPSTSKKTCKSEDRQMQAMKAVALSAIAGELMFSGQAQAAQELAAIAGDNRIGILGTLFLPVIGWVLFNIGKPALNQIDSMSPKSVAIGSGLTLASFLAAGQAQAAQEVVAVAGDNRVAILAALFLPVVGWVLFNIAQPALNQLNNMGNKKTVIAGAGLSAASLLIAGQADAAQEIASLAGDNRVGILATLFLPVIGWVIFNIGKPTLNQLDDMSQ